MCAFSETQLFCVLIQLYFVLFLLCNANLFLKVGFKIKLLSRTTNQFCPVRRVRSKSKVKMRFIVTVFAIVTCWLALIRHSDAQSGVITTGCGVLRECIGMWPLEMEPLFNRFSYDPSICSQVWSESSSCLLWTVLLRVLLLHQSKLWTKLREGLLL